MKSIKMFGKSVPLLAIVITSMLVIGASAGLLQYYGMIGSTFVVTQSILVDGKSVPVSMEITETISGVVAGTTAEGDKHWIRNMADKKITVIVDSDLTDEPAGPGTGVVEQYVEYKLDSLVGDDAVSVELVAPVSWETFTSISFDYLIELENTNTYWIPQINIKLKTPGTEDTVYGVAWHSNNGPKITGTLGERARMTYYKDDFGIYNKDLDWMGAYPGMTWADLVAMETVDSIALVAEFEALEFSVFSQQAGDTSVDPNSGAALSSQIAYVGNYDLTVKGIVVNPNGYTSGDDAVRDTVEFRVVCEFHTAAIPGTYTVETTVKPLP